VNLMSKTITGLNFPIGKDIHKSNLNLSVARIELLLESCNLNL
jgi:hypothetical protein